MDHSAAIQSTGSSTLSSIRGPLLAEFYSHTGRPSVDPELADPYCCWSDIVSGIRVSSGGFCPEEVII